MKEKYLAIEIHGEIFVMNDNDELGGLIDNDVTHKVIGRICTERCNTTCLHCRGGTCKDMKDADGILIYREYDIPLVEKTICASCIALDYDKYMGRVNHKNQLHPAQAWEDARPGHIIYDHFFYKEQTREVRKVTGRIKVVKRVPINGRLVKTDCYRKARWDGFGHCYLGTHNIRSRQSDIVFPSFEDLKGISYGK